MIGFILAIIIAAAAYWRKSLSKSGMIGAIICGTITFNAGFEWAMILIGFFVSSSLLSKIGDKTQAREQFSKGEQRDFGQVFANGGVGTIIALLYLVTKNDLLFTPYLAAFATVNADTWATEIGTLSKSPPRSILNFKILAPGTSGGISALGTGAALAGAAFIGIIGAIFSDDPLKIILLISIAGLIGSLADSFFGATVQGLYYCPDIDKVTEKSTCADGSEAQLRQGFTWINNDVVNLSAALVGCITGMILNHLSTWI